MNPQFTISTNDGRRFAVVVSLFNGIFWFGESDGGRGSQARSYAFPRELSQDDLSVLDPGNKAAERELNRSFRTSAQQFLRFSPPGVADLIAYSR